MGKSFTVENFKGVREISLSPTGALVIIAGGNGAGKSSFIDAFVELFDPKGTRLTPKPIRAGEDEARAEYVDTDLDVRIVRTWKKDDAGKLEVFALDGARYSKPAEVVAQLTGGLIFDPVAFLNLDEKRQRDALLAKVELPFDLDQISRERSGAEQRRLEAGRDVRRLEGTLSSLRKPAADVPDETVNPAELVDELNAAAVHNSRIDGAHEDAEHHSRKIKEIESKIANLQADLEAERDSLARAVERSKVSKRDLAEIRGRLDAVEASNDAIRAARDYRAVKADLDAAREEQAGAQQDLDDIDRRKREGLERAEFPVAGLSVDEDGVTFQGIPFSQVNTAARRRVAFAIATAGDPKLRLVIVKDGDLLDAASLDGIRELAEERGYTVLVERDRDESRQIGFTIQDGALA